MKVKEFNAEGFVENQVNIWFEENKDIKVIDIKYSANEYSSNALIIYEEDSESGKQNSGK